MIEDDEDDYRPQPAPSQQPTMIPVKQFTAYSENNQTVEIVGIHYHDEEANFVAIVGGEDDEIYPSVIAYTVFRKPWDANAD